MCEISYNSPPPNLEHGLAIAGRSKVGPVWGPDEGDAVIDDQTEEEIPDLFVVEIVRQTVRFRYQDTEFVRELQQAKLQPGQGTAKGSKPGVKKGK